MDRRFLDRRFLDERVVDRWELDGLDRRRMTLLSRALPLPLAGRLYYAAVATAALSAGTLAFAYEDTAPTSWLTFVVLAASAATAQVFIVRTGRSHGFHTAIVFVTAGALLLPPELVALMVVIQHVPEWRKERYPAYIQTFNIFNFALAALAAWAVADTGVASGFLGNDPRAAAAGVTAGAVLVLVNHILLAPMLRLARGVSLRDSGLFSAESLSSDIVLAGLGVVLAMVWLSNIWLVPAIVAPLVISYRSIRLLGRARDSEERFRTILEAAPIGMIVRDLDGQIVSTNPAFERMVGYSSDELEQIEAGELFDDTENGLQPEHRFVTKDGSERWGRVDATVVRDAGQRPQFLLSMVQDVTEHKLLEDQLRQAQKMEAIGRLAGGVAHDFNNLLTAISGYTNLVLDRLRERDSDLVDDVNEIERAAQRAHGLTRQLLAFSRKQILQPQILGINDVVGDMDGMLRRLIGENIEVITSYGSGLARVKADPGQLEQVILNLVVNACDEMPGGGSLSIETANVAVTAEEAARRGAEVEPGSFVTLTIRDTGRGMDGETKARMFEPFFTKKSVGKGTGLGLATVYGIVKQSGGFIDVESELGEGASFAVYLPAVIAAVEAPVEPQEPAAAPEPAPGGAESILLVEDEDMVRRYVATVLRGAGYRVLVADCGPEAIEVARQEHVDLLVSDVVMPKISGPELAERLDLPVLFMSGYTGDLIEQHELLQPGTAYIQKPFTADDLRAKVRETLDRAETEPALVLVS